MKKNKIKQLEEYIDNNVDKAKCNDSEIYPLLDIRDKIKSSVSNQNPDFYNFRNNLKYKIIEERQHKRNDMFSKIKDAFSRFFSIKNLAISMSSISMVLVLCFLTYSYLRTKPDENKISNNTNNNTVKENFINKIITPKSVFASTFAKYEETPVNISPKIQAYSTDNNLSNVINVNLTSGKWVYNYPADGVFYKEPTNKDSYVSLELNDSAKDLLIKNNFVVVEDNYQEFFSAYEENRYDDIPSLITTDSVMHTYHLVFDHLLRVLEKDKLSKELVNITADMKAISESDYEKLKDTDWKDAAKINVAFFSVADKLINPDSETKDYVLEEVKAELDKIEKHEGIAESAVMNIGVDMSNKEEIDTNTPEGTQKIDVFLEDYSQYVPRGHYTESEGLKRYFKTMMYLGRMSFRVKNLNETKSAILITNNINKTEEIKNAWNRIYEPTTFFVGKTDDINFYDYSKVLKESYSKENLSLDEILSNKDGLNLFVENAKKLDPPQINSMPIFAPGIVSESKDDQIKAFRFMGQRFTIDASILQKLIYRDVGNKNGEIPGVPDETTRMLPKVLDIPAVMGSEEALNILKSEGEGDYYKYLENLDTMKTYVSKLDRNTFTQNLYWGWIDVLNSTISTKGYGYPSFMQNQSWARKDLNTYISNYTELKRDTILYAKQVMAEMGGGSGEGPTPDSRGYVEPNPYVYAKLASLTKMTKEGLQIRTLLSDKDVTILDDLYNLSMKLKTISEKELNLEDITDDEYTFIKNYGGSIEHLWMKSLEDKLDPNGPYSKTFLEDNPAPVVADIATSPEGLVLEEGTGKIATIYAIVPIDGKLRLTRGATYTHYEFVWPMSNRLTDESWRQLLETKQDAPKIAEWKKSFFVENNEK